MSWRRRLLQLSGGCAAVGGASFVYIRHGLSSSTITTRKEMLKNTAPNRPLPSRLEQIKALEAADHDGAIFDIAVIGGGATGTGVALDAITRGLNVCLIEADDFSSGSSSRSTKLIHGGVRYLESAVKNFDWGKLSLVTEALREREHLMHIAPHLSSSLPIMLPLYSLWDVPQYWLGLKLYDLIARSSTIDRSHFISANSALKAFPLLNDSGLKGAMVYYDGQHNDSRMNLSIALSAAKYGAVVVNHMKAVTLTKDQKSGRVTGLVAQDVLDGNRKEINIRAKTVVNATGAFCDQILRMENPEHENVIKPSRGTHIAMPSVFSPHHMGILSKTKDNRVLFMLPWEGYTIAGTTDVECELDNHPKPGPGEVKFILDELKRYLHPSLKVESQDVCSAWTGIRPLPKPPSGVSTKDVTRSHVVTTNDKGGLVTITGGKWTTYRQMAEDAVEAALKDAKLDHKFNQCQTRNLLLTGSHDFTEFIPIQLLQDYRKLLPKTAKHLAATYGDHAFEVAELAKASNYRLLTQHNRRWPFLEAEVEYAIREYACTPIDFLARRSRLAFLDYEASVEAVPAVVRIMGDRLGWTAAEKVRQTKSTMEFLNIFKPPSGKELHASSFDNQTLLKTETTHNP